MRFGEAVEDDRLKRILTPGDGIHTLITADTYGMGAADTLLGAAIAGTPRDDVFLAGAIGHDFYDGEREGARVFRASPIPGCVGPVSTPPTSRRRRARASSAAASTRSTSSCSTTPTARAIHTRRSGRAWLR